MRILVNEFCGHPFQMELSRELARRGHRFSCVFRGQSLDSKRGYRSRGAPDQLPYHPGSTYIDEVFQTLSPHEKKSGCCLWKGCGCKGRCLQARIVISANMPLDAQRVLQREARQQKARFILWLQDVYSSAVRFVLKKKMGRCLPLRAPITNCWKRDYSEGLTG